jgi:hypothetical protein
MAYLNASIPPFLAYVRAEYLRDLKDSHGTYFPCTVFGVSSIPARVPMFHFAMEDGGLWWRAPISAFCQEPNVKQMDLENQVLWDCFSYNISVHAFEFLKNTKFQYLDRTKTVHRGNYLFTLDWADGDTNVNNPTFAEMPDQHKCGHVLALDNGNYAIQPNNRIKIFDSAFTTKPNQLLIERLVNTHVWAVENNPKWTTSDDNKFEYDIEDTEKGK